MAKRSCSSASSTRAAVFLAAAALAGTLPLAPGCTLLSGWSDLQSGRLRDAATRLPTAESTGTGTTTATMSNPTSTPTRPDGTSGGPDASTTSAAPPTDLPACSFDTTSSCACSGTCSTHCLNGGCQFVAQGATVADFECTAGKCTEWCLSGNCSGDCVGGDCTVHCRAGAACKFDCTGGHCIYACEPGALCQNTCTGGGCTAP